MSTAGKLDILLELTKKSETCICDKCGNDHLTQKGLLADLTKEDIIKILNAGGINEKE